MRISFAVFILSLLVLVVPHTAFGQGALDEELSMFEPYVGKTWRGELEGSTLDDPSIDISRWERALNGKAVRILHSVNDGEYGGETLIVYDRKEMGLVFYYFTTGVSDKRQ